MYASKSLQTNIHKYLSQVGVRFVKENLKRQLAYFDIFLLVQYSKKNPFSERYIEDRTFIKSSFFLWTFIQIPYSDYFVFGPCCSVTSGNWPANMSLFMDKLMELNKS